MKRPVLIASVVVGLILAAGLGVKWWYLADFPDLTPGTYSGVLTFHDSKRRVPWLVVRRPGEQSLAVAVGLVTVSAQRVAPFNPLSGARQPLLVSGSGLQLRLIGALTDQGSYAGDFLNPISREHGSWVLKKTDVSKLTADKDGDLTRWFALWQELERIEGEIQNVQRQVDVKNSAIENLDLAVAEGDVLRKTADSRLGRADSEIEAARSELVIRQQRLDQKLRDFDLTQRVSKEGRLVFLSRETIKRESLWIELALARGRDESKD
jgi:hypothetical protein